MVFETRAESTKVDAVPEYACVPDDVVVGAVPIARRMRVLVDPGPIVQVAVIELGVIPERTKFVGAFGVSVVPHTLVYVAEYPMPS